MSHYPHNEYSARVLARVDDVIAGRHCPWPPAPVIVNLLRVLREHVGKGNAIRRERLAELLGMNDRATRALIEGLRLDFRVAIGSSSEAGASGYYLLSTQAEREELQRMFYTKALALWRMSKALAGRTATAEMHGQIALDLQLTDLPRNTEPEAGHVDA